MLARKTIRKCLDKRGVSPVIANVILATAVIAVGTAALVWATTSFGAHQSGAGMFFLSRSEAMKEGLVIEDVWFYEEGDDNRYVNVTVRNVGTVNMKIAAIYMDSEEVWGESPWIEVGKAVTFKIPFSWNSAEYCIVVATTRGNQVREWRSTSG